MFYSELQSCAHKKSRRELGAMKMISHLQWRIQDFPEGNATTPKSYYFQIFCRKLHENERIWTPGGVHGAPLRSANDLLRVNSHGKIARQILFFHVCR